MKQLPVVEIFDSMQGEGIHTGASATFIRLAGCNLACPFCDTDFTVFTKMNIPEIAAKAIGFGNRLIVLTGGEPLVHPDLSDLISEIRSALNHVVIELETNGMKPLTHYMEEAIDFVSLSPKVPRDRVMLDSCSSLKILFPYLPAVTAEDFAHFPSNEYFIQPIDENLDGIDQLFDSKKNILRAAVEVKRLGYPWRLGVQLHKMIGVR